MVPEGEEPVAGGEFELLACALAGRGVKVVPGGDGEPAWTDGTRIFVDFAAPVAERFPAIVAQSCLIAAGSLDPATMRRLGRRSGPARRYLCLEGHRALLANAAVLPVALRSLPDPMIGARTTCPQDSLMLALGAVPLPEPQSCFGALRPRKLLAAHAIDPNADGAAHRPGRRHSTELDVLESDDPPAIDDPFTSPVGGGGMIGRLLQRLLGATRRLGGNGTPGAASSTHRSRNGARPGAGVFSAAQAGFDDGDNLTGRAGWTYPEWDAGARRYRPDWCTVHETEADLGEDPLVIGDRHALRRPLTRLGIALDRCRRQPEGDDIDIDAVVDARVEIAAGSPPDDRVYVASLPRRRDLAVLVLLDVSGSAAEPGTLGQTVHEQQRLAAATLTVALHELGDRTALYAYHSQGRSSVSLMPVKRFDERLDALTMRRLVGLQPGAYSRLGAAIRHGTAVIENRGATSRRLLVVVSDGLAYDHGYERAYGAADARRALAEARRRGIGCLCLTVGAATDDNDLRRVFGSAAHATIARPAQLGDVIGPLFRSALHSADTRRKVS